MTLRTCEGLTYACMSSMEQYPSLTLLGELPAGALERLMGITLEQQVIMGQRVVEAGSRPAAIYVVLEGLMEAVHPDVPEPLALLGPGEVFGEMSFIHGTEASADVRARENSLLLVVPVKALELLMAEHPGSAVHVLRALAVTLAQRLRRSNDRLEVALAQRSHYNTAADGPWKELVSMIGTFKQRLLEVDQAALKNKGRLAEAIEHEVRKGFTALVHSVNVVLRDMPEGPGRARLHGILQAELLPYLLLSELGERIYAKPRGYAGDYLTIANMYSDVASGVGRLGPLIDRCLRDQAAGQAVRNRRALLAEEIMDMVRRTDGRTLVTSLACGPAQELFDVQDALADPSTLVATCLDIDLQALAHVSEQAGAERRNTMRFVHANLVYLALGRTRPDIPPQHLIYSIGLIDYFNDRFVVNLLNLIHDLLLPGGRCILGNFHPANPTRGLMDAVLDWSLIHRTEDDMHRLFAASKFGGPCARIRFEPAGVNLFAIGERTR